MRSAGSPRSDGRRARLKPGWKVGLALGVAALGLGLLLLRGSPEERYRRLVERGVALMDARRPAEAAELLEKATRIRPEEPMGRYQLARAHFLAQEPEAAIGALDVVLDAPRYRRFVETSREIVDFYSLRAYAAFTLGRHERAASDFEAVVASRPGDGRAWMTLAESRRALGETEGARAAARRALDAGFSTAESLTLLGALDEELGELEQARSWLESAIEQSPGYTVAYHRLARTLRRLGRREEALAMGELATRLAVIDDEVSKFNTRIATRSIPREKYRRYMEDYAHYCLRYRKDLHLAEAAQRLLILDGGRADGRAEYYLYRGTAAARLGQERLAASHLRRAVELQPDLAAAHAELAVLLAGARDPEVKDPEEAVRRARRATELGGDPDALVVALDAAGDAAEAAALASWPFLPGGAWPALRKRRVEAFQRRLLEAPVEPLLLDVDVER